MRTAEAFGSLNVVAQCVDQILSLTKHIDVDHQNLEISHITTCENGINALVPQRLKLLSERKGMLPYLLIIVDIGCI